MSFNTTKEYLDYYKTLQEIEVVYRGNEKVGWGRNRNKYTEYDKEYNHRSILDNEVVFDFDGEELENKINLEQVLLLMDKVNLNYSVWHTGGKGFHIHTFWNKLKDVQNPSLLKKVILKFFAEGKQIDYQLVGKHLIRAEHGLYEKSIIIERYKKLIKDKNGLELNEIPSIIYKLYVEESNADIIRKTISANDTSISDSKIKSILSGDLKVEDGREKVLFFLIHQLKKTHTPKEVFDLLYTWYKYSGGTKIDKLSLKYKIKSHWNKTYSFRPDYLDQNVKFK